MKLFGWLKKKKKVCEHKTNFYMRKWRTPDGTPMIYFRCYDCGHEDRGHVYAETWPDDEITDKRKK